jgi:hypothetical protein
MPFVDLLLVNVKCIKLELTQCLFEVYKIISRCLYERNILVYFLWANEACTNSLLNG